MFKVEAERKTRQTSVADCGPHLCTSAPWEPRSEPSVMGAQGKLCGSLLLPRQFALETEALRVPCSFLAF